MSTSQAHSSSAPRSTTRVTDLDDSKQNLHQCTSSPVAKSRKRRLHARRRKVCARARLPNADPPLFLPHSARAQPRCSLVRYPSLKLVHDSPTATTCARKKLGPRRCAMTAPRPDGRNRACAYTRNAQRQLLGLTLPCASSSDDPRPRPQSHTQKSWRVAIRPERASRCRRSSYEVITSHRRSLPEVLRVGSGCKKHPYFSISLRRHMIFGVLTYIFFHTRRKRLNGNDTD